MATDIATLCVLMFLLWRGCRRGFVRSLLGPLAFFIGTMTAFYYYGMSTNLILSLIIGLVTPFVLYRVFRFFLDQFNSRAGGQVDPGPISGLAGAAVTAAWGMSLTFPVVILLTYLPPLNPTMAAIRKDAAGSQTFTMIKAATIAFKMPLTIPSGTHAASAAAGNTPLQALANDPKIQDLLKDPDVIKAVEEKNYAALMSNPKFVNIAKDPAFMQKFLAAYAAQQQASLSAK